MTLPKKFITWIDPDETDNFEIDWTLDLEGETIQSSSWAVDTGLTYNSDSNTTTSATLWVSGGVVGSLVYAVNTITTSGGRTLNKSILFVIRDS